MTSDELRQKYNQAYRIIRRERAMRAQVFKEGDPRRQPRLDEMDQLMDILTELKDFCKAHIDPEFEQPRLLDAPRKVDY